MSIKNILLSTIYTLWDGLHIIEYYGFKRHYNIPLSHNDCLRVFGNGKSLEEIELLSVQNADNMVVNGHVFHSSYSVLKPTCYCLIDSAYFSEQYDNDCLTLRAINEKTTWKMYLFIPYSKKNIHITNGIINNPNITIITFSAMVFRGFDRIKYWVYSKGLASPEVRNIISVCIMQSIMMKYKRVELYGVEHNWTKYITVEDDNYVYLEDMHFYDKEKIKPQPFIYLGEHVTMYQALKWYSLMFKTYLEIVEYIKSSNIQTKIINKTKGSFIDAFERE